MKIQQIEEKKSVKIDRNPENEKRAFTVELVRRWGGLATDALLDPNSQIFSIPSIEGFIGYRKAWGCIVVYGDPVCSPQDVAQLAQAFHDFCKREYKNVIYLAASERFAKWAIQHLCETLIEYGEEVFLDPHFNPKQRQGKQASLVRRKVRHALKEGVLVKEYLSYNMKKEQAIEEVGLKWLQGRRGAQMHISNVHLFKDCLGKRWFYAHQGERFVGVVVLNQLQAHQGWHLNHLMFIPEAPHGTPELLITSVLEILERENCSFVSFGIVPAPHLGECIGLSSFSSWIAKRSYKIAHKIFRLQGHKTFWGKFYPQFKPSYLLFSQPRIGFREVYAIMRAMNVSF